MNSTKSYILKVLILALIFYFSNPTNIFSQSLPDLTFISKYSILNVNDYQIVCPISSQDGCETRIGKCVFIHENNLLKFLDSDKSVLFRFIITSYEIQKKSYNGRELLICILSAIGPELKEFDFLVTYDVGAKETKGLIMVTKGESTENVDLPDTEFMVSYF